ALGVLLVAVAMALALDVTAQSAGGPTASPCGACAAYASPRESGRVSEPALRELSGLAASRVHAGVYYAHNDSGDRARVVALDARGSALGEFRLAGATATDWEDIAVGPCPRGSCVYLADTGDNDANRPEIALYRVEEPPAPRAHAAPVDVAFERFAFRYPDG